MGRAGAAVTAVSLLWVSGRAVAQQPETTPKPPPPPSPLVVHDQPDEGYEDRPIREVRLERIKTEAPTEREPVPTGIAMFMRNQIRTLEGRPYKQQTIKDDVTRLNRTGRFKTITTRAQLHSDGSVVVTFTVLEQPIIQDVQVVGNRLLTDQEILAAAGNLAQTSVERFRIDRAARAIEDLYRARGYHAARVEIDEKELADSSIVVFRVIEGQAIKVMGVQFEGNRSFKPKELRTAIKTTEYIPIFESAPLDNEVRANDAASLTRFYRDRGYLDVRVSSRVQESPNGREAIVVFQIDEGPLYTLRSVRVLYKTPDAVREYRDKFVKDPRSTLTQLTPEQMAQLGRRSFTAEQLAGLMAIKPGDVYSEDKIRKSIENVRAAYGKLGNIVEKELGPGAPEVVDEKVRDESKPEVDVVLYINEGKAFKVGAIEVIGNNTTKQQVILRQMEVLPDRPLDAAALAESRKRLEQTRLFEPGSIRIAIQPERPDEPGKRDVTVEITEGTTGKFSVGAAVGSDSGVIGQIRLTQTNFDLYDVPDSWSELFGGHAFRGGGQTATLAIEPGLSQQNYSLSLKEPYLMESNYSGEGKVYFTTRDLQTYDEERYGAIFGVGRRFGTVWEGSLRQRTEWVTLSGIDADRPTDFFAVEDSSLITSLAVAMSRTTTDNTLRPTRGSRLDLSVEQVGALGGDFDFTKFTGGYKSFYNLYESFLGYKTILKLENTIGYVPQGQGAVPFFERYYLGGQSFRGFNYRGVAPVGVRNDNGQPSDDQVGGTFEFFLGAELNQPLYEDIVAGVLFIDTGMVDKNVEFDHYRVSVGFGVRLNIKALSPIPLAFDFGFPVVKEDTDRERVFTFSIDVPFR